MLELLLEAVGRSETGNNPAGNEFRSLRSLLLLLAHTFSESRFSSWLFRDAFSFSVIYLRGYNIFSRAAAGVGEI